MRAQGAREYLNTPVNAATGFVEFVGTKAQTAPSSDVPLPNNTAITRLGSGFFLWSFPQRGLYGGVSVSANYGTAKVEGAAGDVESSGWGDPAIAFHANVFGLPGLRREEFASWDPRTFFSVHLTVNAPLGSYDPNSPVNMGANRWAISPLGNLNITPDKGVSWIEFYVSGRFSTHNNEFQGDNQLSEDPLLKLAAHYSHNIGKTMYAAIGVFYDYGGETAINGVPQDDAASAFRPTASVSARFGTVRVTVRYENTASKPDAAPKNALVAVRVAGPLF
jgi:hypothetical protein